jgi:multiple sugar transport system ATP-binding protein
MRAEISKLQDDLGVTTIYVTHDQVEAMTMGDRVAVMRKGELQQVATPQDLYDHPVNLFVGGFIGSPAMNLVEAKIARANGGVVVEAGGQSITLGQQISSARPALKDYEGRKVVLGIRPEDLEDSSLASDVPADRRVRGRVELREALGSEIMVHFTIDAPPAITEDVRELAQDIGDERAVQEASEAPGQTTMVGRFGARSKVRVGETAEVCVDTRSLHFFDPETGLGIYDNTQEKGAR